MRRRQDRWREFKAQPGTAAFDHIDWYEAIDAEDIDISDNPNISVQVLYNIKNNSRRSHYEIVSKGSVACYYSHTNLWKWLVDESDANMMCVMEDDLKLDPDSFEKLSKLLNDPIVKKGDWDILNPGAIVGSKTPLSPTICLYNRSFLFHCYFITKKGAEKLLKTAFPIQMHIDHYASFCAAVGRIKIIGPCTRMLFQRNSESDNRTDFKCNSCNVPTLEDPKHGRYISNMRARMYEMEESFIVVGLFLAALYAWKKL